MTDKKLTLKQKISLTEQIIKFLIKHELFYDVSIYAAGRRYSSNKHNGFVKIEELSVKTDDCAFTVWRSPGSDVKVPCEYGNPDTLTMTFEGPFYSVVNYRGDTEYCDRITGEFNEILKQYGLYYELGHAWSLSLYFDWSTTTT